MVDDTEAAHRFRWGILSRGQRGHHRIQERQSDCGSDPAKYGPP
jgi:hypothetical protein